MLFNEVQMRQIPWNTLNEKKISMPLGFLDGGYFGHHAAAAGDPAEKLEKMEPATGLDQVPACF
jgi:hypothetical protein